MKTNNLLGRDLVLILPVLFTWLIMFQFNQSYELFQSDLIMQHLSAVFNNFGVPNVYSFNQLGGSLLRPLHGYIPLEGFLSFFIRNEVKVLTYMAIILCTLNGIWSLLALKTVSEKRLSSTVQILVCLIFTFLPLSAWRIVSGHLNFLLGINLFCLLLLYAARLYKKNITLTLNCVVVLMLMNIISHPPIAQIFLYLCLLLIPIGVKFSIKNIYIRKNLLILLLSICGLVLISWDQILLFVQYQMSGEFPRSEEPAIYSYLKLDPKLFISLFVSSKSILNYMGINPSILHEINYPIGIGSLILVIKLLFKETKAIKWGVAAILAFAFVYASGISIFESIFKETPILNMFRVPSRVFILVSLLSMFYIVYNVIKEVGSFKELEITYFFLLFPTIFYDAIFLEIILFFLVIFSFKFSQKISGILLITLCLLNLSSFKERIHLFEFDYKKRVQIKKRIESKRLSSQFESGYALSKDPSFDLNTASFYSLPSIEGYNTPLKNFLIIYSSLLDREYRSTRMIFEFSNSADYEVLKNLYNVNLSLDLNENVNLVKKRKKLKLGRSPILVTEFKEQKDQLSYMKNHYQKEDFLKDNVTAFKGLIDKKLKRCYYEKIKSKTKIGLDLLPNSSFPCLIVLPFNYSSFIKLSSDETIIIPVDIALLGLFIKNKPVNKRIILDSKYDFIKFIYLKIVLWGLIVFVVLLTILNSFYRSSKISISK